MSNSELISGGLKLLVCGMGMVYVFLGVMIACMFIAQKALAPFAKYFEPKADDAPAAKRDDDSEILAAIAACAVENHR